MNKRQEIKFWKEQLKVSHDIMTVAKSQIEQATRVEVVAKNRLAELGGSAGRAPKGEVLTDSQKLSIKASVIKIKKPAAGTAG